MSAVQISNVSDEHIEKLEKKFSEGRKVPARVTGFRMMDGLAIVSLKVEIQTRKNIPCFCLVQSSPAVTSDPQIDSVLLPLF